MDKKQEALNLAYSTLVNAVEGLNIIMRDFDSDIPPHLNLCINLYAVTFKRIIDEIETMVPDVENIG